jgi:predicted nucleotidyltransferase
MTANPIDDPILRRFKTALAGIYCDELERVILFGSRARGDARPASDNDIAVFLKSLPDRWKELNRLATLRVDFLDEVDAFFDAKPYASSSWMERTPLMREIRRDGLEI